MMKNVLKLAMTFFVFTGIQQANAQFAFGLKGGLNLSNLNVKDAHGSYDSRTGYHAGIFLRGKFDKVAIQPEVLLFTQNNKIYDYGTVGSVNQSFTYLSIPVMVKFYPVGGLNIQAGPQFSFLLDGKRTFDNTFGYSTQSIKTYYKSNDVSVSLGAGYDFDFGLGLDVRYNVGVEDINNTNNGEKVKSQVFLVSIGWNFLAK